MIKTLHECKYIFNVKTALNVYFSVELAKEKVLVEITIDKKVIYNKCIKIFCTSKDIRIP